RQGRARRRPDAGLRVRGTEGETVSECVSGSGADRQRGRRSLGPAGPAPDHRRERDRPRPLRHAQGRRMTATKAERHSAILNLVARRIDEAALPGIAGTVAGDDTIIAVLRQRGAVRALKNLLADAG